MKTQQIGSLETTNTIKFNPLETKSKYFHIQSFQVSKNIIVFRRIPSLEQQVDEDEYGTIEE